MQRHRRYDNEHNHAINEEAEVRIRELELEIAQMRQNLAIYGNGASEHSSSDENSDDIMDVFSEWRRKKNSAEEQQAFYTDNMQNEYEPNESDYEDLRRYMRSEHNNVARKRLKPVWVAVAFVLVMSAAAFGIGKWAGTETMAQQDSTLTVIETSMTAESTTIAAENTTVAAESTTISAESTAVTAEKTSVAVKNTTVAAEKTTVTAEKTNVAAETSAPELTVPDKTVTGNEIVVAGANNTGTSQEPNTSMVAIGKKIVYIDPGHGGNDHGCVYGGVSEKDIDLEIAMLLGAVLENMGYEVVYTREHDEYFSLSKRAKFANDSAADIFVSVHCNAYEDASVYGMDVYHNKVATADQLAEGVFNSLADKLDTKARSFAYGSYQVLRQSKMPGILIEIGFLSNDSERKNLCDEEYQALAADAIAEAIHEYFAAQEAD